MRKRRSIPICLMLLIAAVSAAKGAAPKVEEMEQIPVLVFINEENKGEHIVLMTPEEDMYFPAQAMRDIGFKEVPAGVLLEGVPHVSLRGMAPDVVFKFDMENIALRITAKPELLKGRVLDFEHEAGVVPVASETSAYLNYSVIYGLDSRDKFVSLNLPWEFALRLGGTAVFSSFNTSRSRSDESAVEDSVRLFSNLTWDFPAAQTTVVAGDFSAFSGELGGGGTFGGISITRNFELIPSFKAFPGLRLTGVAETVSQIDIYINDSLVSSRRLPPGEFEILNPREVLGRGVVKMVITDAFGREKIVEAPFFISTELLKAGTHDFRYNVGSRRVDLGTESNEYGSPALLGLHRFGVFDWLTLGLTAEAGTNESIVEVPVQGIDTASIIENEVVNYGGSATIAMGLLGGMTVGWAYSEEKGETDTLTGSAAILRYSFPASRFSFGFSGRSFSPLYATLSQPAILEGKLARAWSVSVAASFGFLGAVSTNYSVDETFNRRETISRSLDYSLPIGRAVSVNASAQRDTALVDGEEAGDSLSIKLGLNVSLGNAQVDFRGNQNSNGSRSQTGSISHRIDVGDGLRYNLSGTRSEDATGEVSNRESIFAQYLDAHGVYTLNQRRDAESRNTDLQIAGSFAWIGDTVASLRPIRDGFALVKVGDLEGVRVRGGGQSAVTDRFGEALLPGMSSYRESSIKIEIEDVPVDYDLERTTITAAVPFRGGAIVNFRPRKLQGFTGFLFIREKGEAKSAEYQGLTFKMADKIEEYIIGKGGEFYFENVPPGLYPARVFSEKRECRFDLVVPESKETIVDLGEVYCEIN